MLLLTSQPAQLFFALPALVPPRLYWAGAESPAAAPLWLAGTRQSDSTRKPEAGGECKLSTAVIARMAAEHRDSNRQNLNL